jgi:cytochrome c oxidase assembly protein subunit 15
MSVVTPNQAGSRAVTVLTLGFGTAVVMWAIGYFARLPAIMAPSPALLAMLLVGGFTCGLLAGFRVPNPVRTSLQAGLVVGVLNLLIMGSFLVSSGDGTPAPSALIWIPGSIVVSAILVMSGAWLGSWFQESEAEPADFFPSSFVWVAAAATFLLLAVGGLVTSKEAGLAVVDWPNSYGYNMFLYPLSRMTGGIYYEHAHRLFGSLVGLSTVVMAIVLQKNDDRRWVRRLGWIAVGMVILQGILGGLRVTGGFTFSTSPTDMAPSLLLALVHGVFGQAFFATLVVLGVTTSSRWRDPDPDWVGKEANSAKAVQLGKIIIALLLLQLILGALQRHMQMLLWIHITVASILAPLAAWYGLRTWMLNLSYPPRRKLGLWLMATVGTQVLLGISAFAGTLLLQGKEGSDSLFAITAATAHQWCGAVLLAITVATLLWNGRDDFNAGSL